MSASRNGLLTLARYKWIPVLVFVACSGLTVLLSQYVDKIESQARDAKFREFARHAASLVQRQLDRNFEQLYAMAAFYDNSNFVDPDEFHGFASELLALHKSTQALEWVPRVPDSERDKFEQEVRAAGFENFQIVEQSQNGVMARAGQREEYFPVQYIEPLAGNQQAKGYDLASDAVRKAAIDTSRIHGHAEISGSVTLVQESTTQTGVLAFFPIYKQRITTPQNLNGFVVGVFRLGDLMAEALSLSEDGQPVVALYDSPAENGDGRMFASAELGAQDIRNNADTAAFEIHVPGRTWQLYVAHEARFDAEGFLEPCRIILIAGLILSLLIAIYIRTVFRSAHEQRAQIAELEKTKSELMRATQTKSDFLANMSHEIRTPLNGIIGIGDMLLRTSLTEQQSGYLDKMRSSSKALLSIINDILDYSKIEAGKLALESADFQIEELLSNVSNLFVYSINAKGVSLRLKIDHRIPAVLIGDPLRLSQVFNNLVGNAVKFTEHGAIGIEVELGERIDNRVKLLCKISDSGIGMTVAQQEKLFRAFTQVDTSTTRKYGGSGLGLAICKQLVDMMGGQIWVESEEGVGTKFFFTVWLDCRANEKPVGALGASLNSKRILVVDDMLDDLQIIDHILYSWGVSASLCNDPEEAIALAREKPFDYLITDWQMPGKNGIDLIKALREILGENCPRIIMVTAYEKEDLLAEIESKNVHVDSVVTKPFTASCLFNALALKQEVAPTMEAGKHLRVSGRVLLVEDHLINREVATDHLKYFGLEVDIAENGLEAVEKTHHGNYDLILMDLQMPVMDGFQAARKIREFNKNVPIVALSAAVMQRDRERTEAVGMNGHLAKPIDLEELRKVLSQYLTVETQTDESASAPAGDDTAAIEVFAGLIDIRELVANVHSLDNAYRHLRNFAATYADTVAQLPAMDVASDDFKRFTHTLKGVSGNLRMTELYPLAREIDTSDDPGTKAKLLPQLATALSEVLALIKVAVPAGEQGGDRKLDISSVKRDELLKQLAEALASRRPKNITPVMDELGKYTLAPADDALLKQIAQHVNAFDFKAALTVLEGRNEH